MKTKLILALWLSFLIQNSQAQEVEPSQVELKVRNDLEQVIGSVINPSEFGLQVTVQADTQKERLLIHDESANVSIDSPNDSPSEPLPGFTSLDGAKTPTKKEERKAYKEVEKTILKSVQIFSQIDNKVTEKDFRQAQKLILEYASKTYGKKAKVNVSRSQIVREATWDDYWQTHKFSVWSVTLALAALLLGALALKFILRNRKSLPDAERPLFQNGDIEKSRREEAPAISEARDPREAASELFNNFVSHIAVFRLYWKKIDENERREIYEILRGPAFNNLLESLELARPEHLILDASSQGEKLIQYETKFREFVQATKLYASQFFGFLQLLSLQQVLTLLTTESKIAGAAIIKYAPVDISAESFRAVPKEIRAGIVQEMKALNGLPFMELQILESQVRAAADRLPQLQISSQMKELETWEKILETSEQPEFLLGELESHNPSVYAKLSKYKFKLDDLEMVPQDIVSEIFDGFDNHELSNAFSALNPQARNYALGAVSEKRRRLIESQIQTMVALNPRERQKAVHDLTTKLREVVP